MLLSGACDPGSWKPHTVMVSTGDPETSQRMKQDDTMLMRVQYKPRSSGMEAHFPCKRKWAGVLEIRVHSDVPPLQCQLMSLKRVQKR